MTLIFSSLVDPICEVIEEDGGGAAAAVFSLDYFNVHFFRENDSDDKRE